VDVHSAMALRANQGLACPGVQLSGQGFVIDGGLVGSFSQATQSGILKKYLTGWEINNRPRSRYVIDAFGLSDQQLRTRYPEAYQHLLTHVFPERSQNPRPVYAKNWWLHSEPRAKFRKAFQSLERYCATSRTSKHRFFVFCDNATLPETKVLIIALSDAFLLGVLSSRFHVAFSEQAGSRLGVGNDPTYNHTECFDTFPFPTDAPAALKDRIRTEAEALDAVRKLVLSRHSDLTLTDIYNVLAALHEGRPLTADERDVHERGLVSVIRRHHDEIDCLVAQAYGWPIDLTNEEVLTRLVALNNERMAEEAKGLVRWLRPEFQAPGEVTAISGTLDLGETIVAAASSAQIPWPKSLPDQVTAISKILTVAPKPLSSRDVAQLFDRKRTSTIEPVLNALTAIGQARRLADGRYAA
jgi:hypothetical protein